MAGHFQFSGGMRTILGSANAAAEPKIVLTCFWRAARKKREEYNNERAIPPPFARTSGASLLDDRLASGRIGPGYRRLANRQACLNENALALYRPVLSGCRLDSA